MPEDPLILAVDDTLNNLKVISGLLKQSYRIQVATSGEEALQLVADRPHPDLILLDIMMPGMDGYAVCKRLKDDPATRDIPVIFLSAKTQSEDEVKGFAVGAADYVPKPINPPVLKARVAAQLALAAQLRERHQMLHQRIAEVSEERDRTEIERQRIHDRQQALLAITRAALRDLTPQHFLVETLDLLNAIDWLDIEPRGLLFLFNRHDELVLVAEHGMSINQGMICTKARQGSCLCGQALLKRQTLFLAEVSESTQHCIMGPLKVGGYSLPLTEGERIYGALCIIMPQGHTPQPGEQDFMNELADAFSGLIRRRMIEEKLRINQIEIQMVRNEVIRRLGVAAEFRDTETGLHVTRMSQYARAIARTLHCDETLCELIELAAPMHDVGKIGIDDSILRKPGKLTAEEFATMKRHTLIGARILEGNDPLIELAREIALTHHEKWDGSGYPHGLSREAIPLSGRICAVADVFDALTMERPYKEAWPVERAVATIESLSESSFDPRVVRAFSETLPELLTIKARYQDDAIDPRELLPAVNLEPGRQEWIVWSERFSVGIDIIDEHHRYLIYWANRVHSAIKQQAATPEVAKALFALEQYTRIHFRAEERLISALGRSPIELESHQLRHREFEEKLHELRLEIAHNPFIAGVEMLEYLRSWLIDHILKSDRKILKPVAKGA
ncbi:bacteriohemerythrin [Thiorhodococcus fuscus]|uniref:Bacteriohemerythrin n=1 Tax=Thiorhodococcus fuscus TaxID=527200 RepID=A0ABW4Y6D3_9GAMM